MLQMKYKSETKDGLTVHNIPYFKYEEDYDDEELIGAGTILKNSWLINEYNICLQIILQSLIIMIGMKK